MQIRLHRILGSLPVFFAGATAGVAAFWLLSRRAEPIGARTAALDLPGLEAATRELSGGEHVSLRDLGGGIVEAFGDAADADAVERVLSFVRERPGVSVVVNRIWTAVPPREMAETPASSDES
jgi:hypothetical protein